MNERLLHDCSWQIAISLMQNLAGLFMDHERRDAFNVIYDNIRAGIESYETKKQRELQRIHPSSN